MSDEKSISSIFQKKYSEFCDDLAETYSERSREIAAARGLTEQERMQRFRAEVLPTAGNPSRNPTVNPGAVLPGVHIEDAAWASFSENTQKAIQQYLTLLSFTCMFGDSNNPWESTFGSNDGMKAWMDTMMKDWKDKLSKVDFKNITDKIMHMFGDGGSGFKIPERLLKGQLAKLAEELVREFKPEDFGLSAEQLGGTDGNPGQAFELLMNIYTQRPEILQNAMKRIAKRLQEKVRRGELRPQELAAEAEEMMKEFTDNPAFVELMESFRNVFGFEDQDTARAAGRDGDNRRAIAQRRLREERERREQRRAQAAAEASTRATSQSQSNAEPSVEELMQRIGLSNTASNDNKNKNRKSKK